MNIGGDESIWSEWRCKWLKFPADDWIDIGRWFSSSCVIDIIDVYIMGW